MELTAYASQPLCSVTVYRSGLLDITSMLGLSLGWVHRNQFLHVLFSSPYGLCLLDEHERAFCYKVSYEPEKKIMILFHTKWSLILHIFANFYYGILTEESQHSYWPPYFLVQLSTSCIRTKYLSIIANLKFRISLIHINTNIYHLILIHNQIIIITLKVSLLFEKDWVKVATLTLIRVILVLV